METLKLKHYKILVLLGIWLSTVPVFSQVETYEDCFSKKSNADLKNLNKKQKGEAVDGRFYTSNARIKAEGMVWQTSFFRDRPPKFVVSKTKPKNQTHNEWAEDTCLFNAYNVQDQQAGTYWCEGVPGTGIGEVVVGLIDVKNKTISISSLERTDFVKISNRIPVHRRSSSTIYFPARLELLKLEVQFLPMYLTLANSQ